MADILALMSAMATNGDAARIARNPLAQFGTRNRRYLGAEILPERLVPENAYREENVKYRSVLANAGTRYSPTQKKGGALVGSVDVILAESDIASELTSRDYDALLSMLAAGGAKPSMEAIARTVRFLDTTINIPMVELLEVWRWQAIVSALVQARGDNDYAEDFAYPNPAGFRVVAGAAWSNDATDIYEEVLSQAQVLVDAGFQVGRIITSRRVVSIAGGNALMQKRAGRITVDSGGQITATQGGRATLRQINAAMAEDGLPPWETYDLMARTSTGTVRFLPDNVFVMIAATGRDEELDLGDGVIERLDNTLGYTGVGRAAGQTAPGRVIQQKFKDDKPPRIEAEGWQTAMPVILEPEGIAVIGGIS
jgi:hypothetical protein